MFSIEKFFNKLQTVKFLKDVENIIVFYGYNYCWKSFFWTKSKISTNYDLGRCLTIQKLLLKILVATFLWNGPVISNKVTNEKCNRFTDLSVIIWFILSLGKTFSMAYLVLRHSFNQSNLALHKINGFVDDFDLTSDFGLSQLAAPLIFNWIKNFQLKFLSTDPNPFPLWFTKKKKWSRLHAVKNSF